MANLWKNTRIWAHFQERTGEKITARWSHEARRNPCRILVTKFFTIKKKKQSQNAVWKKNSYVFGEVHSSPNADERRVWPYYLSAAKTFVKTFVNHIIYTYVWVLMRYTDPTKPAKLSICNRVCMTTTLSVDIRWFSQQDGQTSKADMLKETVGHWKSQEDIV